MAINHSWQFVARTSLEYLLQQTELNRECAVIFLRGIKTISSSLIVDQSLDRLIQSIEDYEGVDDVDDEIKNIIKYLNEQE